MSTGEKTQEPSGSDDHSEIKPKTGSITLFVKGFFVLNYCKIIFIKVEPRILRSKMSNTWCTEMLNKFDLIVIKTLKNSIVTDL